MLLYITACALCNILFLLWPLYHIYGVCYVYYFLINIYGIMIISINLDYRKYGIGIMVISINLDYRKYGIG
jgi:hypothetical protein